MKVKDLNLANAELTQAIEQKEEEIKDLKEELTKISATENQWRSR